ncbi:KGG domain-containing protein [Deinococcus aquaedulcis]|uniref:KGG domain-containing protein n=1 Tax=Deinococcus aquaedulcis TaxID=2840455 RepID=UPI001C82B389|nr:KGG domain-containing protein [Deinococcus aquaedulcis]
MTNGNGNGNGGNGGNEGKRNGGGRGFAGMDPERQRAIAAEGGRAAHASGNAHEFTSEEAREAGRKGGQASRGGQGGSGGEEGSGQRGGTSEQHAEAGRQSHKND